MNKIIILLALLLIPFVYASDYGVHWEDTEINVNTPDYGVHWEDTEINVNTLFGNLTNLSEMADVNISSPTDKQLFQFLTSDNKWHPYSFLLSDWWSYDYGDLINTPTSLSDFINDLGIGDWATDKPDYSTTTEADTLYYGIGNPSGFYNSTDFSITDYSTTANIISFD